MSQNGKALFYIPQRFRTQELCKLALERDGLALSYVPSRFKDENLCTLAVTNNKQALTHVPEQMRTDEIFALARGAGTDVEKIEVQWNVFVLKSLGEKLKVKYRMLLLDTGFPSLR